MRGDDEIGVLATAFNRMAERRSQAERARRSLVADVAHELRTPLTNLTAQIEALEDGLAAPDAAALASLHEEVDQHTHQVEDLSELAVADAGGLHLSPRRLRLGDEFAAVRTAVEPRAREAGISIDVAGDADAMAFADARRLRQALRNLLENAIAHTPSGGRITLGARRVPSDDRSTIEIAVADTGEGIPAAHLGLVFERFHRVDPSRARATGGRGLGLAIVKQYVEAMGGAVRAESAPGRGTRMVLTLPLDGPPRPRATLVGPIRGS